MKTLLLDASAWDLVLDASGNIALADEPYALAQDAASAVRTFAGEAYYDTTLGVPYFETILGLFPPAQVMKAAFVKEALRVPDVVSASAFLTAVINRQLGGQVQITTSKGVTLAVAAATPIAAKPGSSGGSLDFSDPDNSALQTL